MYIEKQSVRGKEYIRLVENIVKRDKNGELKTSKKIVKNLGSLNDLSGGDPDFLTNLRESFRCGKPLLAELEPYVEGTAAVVTQIAFAEGTEDCRPRRYMFADALLDRFFKDLGLSQLLSRVKSERRMRYDLAGMVRLLVYGRLLHPCSKIATAAQNDAYLNPPLQTRFCSKDVYKALDVLYEYHEQILRTIHRRLVEKMSRDTTVVFYDVTNTFFQTDEPDADIVDETGICLSKGLRKRGKSKENRRDPLIQIALFMDANGIPLTTEVFPGNMPDVSTMRPMLQKTLKMTGLGKFIFVADRGICARQNCLALILENAGYIISKSILKGSRKEQDWILNDLGWTDVSLDFRYKSKIVTEKVKDADGKCHELREKVIVYWSRKYRDKQRREHESMVQFLHSLEDDRGGVPLDKVEKTYVKKAFLNSVVVKSKEGIPSGEVIPKSELLEMIDTEKLKRDIDLFGYYQIITSEIDMPDLDAIRTYKQLVQIETEFRDMKGVLDLRPVYVRTPEHISAHVLLCFVALTILRLIQTRIVEANSELEDEDRLWTWGMSADRLRAALNDWQVVQMPDGYYAFSREGGAASDEGVNKDLDVILDAYDIDIPLKLFTKGDVSRIRKSIAVFR